LFQAGSVLFPQTMPLVAEAADHHGIALPETVIS
jgi:hypothetical protein